ncbi:MAG: type I restriction endonuclease [Bacteroidetes bacterium]|nr:type I restriction endonuclease [Bacteroidota bacterium]
MGELKRKIDELGNLFDTYRNENLSESNTELYFIYPFLSLLGYDISNPELVSSQYLAVPDDIKTGRVDLALLQNGNPIIFVEGKKLNEPLDHHVNQIKRYFNNCRKVNFAILTNGNEYRFYTDLDHKNMLDEEPFLKFELKEVAEDLVEQLEQFTSQNFDSKKLRNQARKISRRGKIISFFKKQFSSPSEEFLKNMSKMIFYTTKIDYKNAVKETLPDVPLSLVDIKDIIPPPVIKRNGKQTEPNGEKNIFDIGDVTGKKLDYFRFQNEVIRGKNWADMFIHIFDHLSQENQSKLMSVSEENPGLKIERDEKLIQRYPKPIGTGLFISTNYSSNDKIRYLQNALLYFNMKDALRVKLK